VFSIQGPDTSLEQNMVRCAALFATTVLASVGIAAGAFATDAEALHDHRGETRASLFRADTQLSRAMTHAGPVEGFLRNAAADVTYLHPGQEILVSRGNVGNFLRSTYSAYLPGVSTGLHRVAGDVSADGTLGYTFGWLDETRTPRESTAVELSYGRYAAVWRRQGREWQVEVFLRLGGNAPLPPPPADALLLDGEAGVKLRDHPEAHALTASVADARFADLSLARGYSVAFDRYAADAAILLTAGDIFWNRAGVNAAFGGWTPDQSLRWHPLRAGAAASGDLAWTVGHGNFHFNVGTPTESRSPSKYLTVWLRTPDGWRFLFDGGNARPADPVP
jgi:ketosteroid isomerase-like protein